MQVVGLICAGMLAVAGLACLWRMAKGPTTLNRTLASDVLIATLMAGFAVEAAVGRDDDTLPVLLSLAMVGFVGTVSIARFARREDEQEEQ